MIFIDTNYFLRFLLGDVKDQQIEAEKLFLDAADGKVRLFTSTIVFFEVYWVVNGQFEKNKEKVGEILDKLLRMVFVDIENRDILFKAVNLYKQTSLGLADVFNMVYAQTRNATDFKTFDKKLIKKLIKPKK